MMPCFHTSPSTGNLADCKECKPRKNGYTKDTETEMKLQDSPMKIAPMDQDRNSEARVLSCNLKNNPGNLSLVSDFVMENRGAIIRPPDNEVMSDMYIRICGLDGTVYSGEQYKLEVWGEVYLPEPTKMEVLGILESSEGMPTFPQWIVLMGEDGHVFGYEDEVLYVFASSLEELLQKGFNTDISYDYPDDRSDEEEEDSQEDEEIQRLIQKTDEFINSKANNFTRFLKLQLKV
ncbi:unnamed protein product [Staurois parvus]|uniref:US22 family protein n=1 Tax=Staurois parvus TaxID=386267 RepID=A0ABN9CT80_9NEOB|nr:unnamed protein product [Staurois parvus]